MAARSLIARIGWIGISAVAAAQPLPPGPPPFPPGQAGRPELAPPPLGFLKDLELSEAQRQAAQAIVDKHRPLRIAREKAAREKERALLEGLEEPSTPEAALRELHQAAAEARFGLLLEDRAVLRDVLNLLTPAQQAKAQELRKQQQKIRAEQEHHRQTMEELGAPCR